MTTEYFQKENGIVHRLHIDQHVSIYTDGSCHNAKGDGGWGVFITMNGYTIELSGAKGGTTSNVMEMTAVYKALKAQGNPAIPVIVYTDSQYVQRGMTGGFKNMTKNHKLWKKLLAQKERFSDIKIEWVKGHAGNPGNERADFLAGEAMKKGREMRAKL